MKANGIVRWSIVLALMLMPMTASLALAATGSMQSGVSTSTLEATSTPTSTLEAASTLTSTLSAGSNLTGTIEPTSTLSITAQVTPTLEPTSTPTPTPTPTPTVIPTPGHNPETAIEPTGAWRFIDPNATHWYRMRDARLQLDIWMDANGQQGLSMAIYAPDQTDLYGKPVGRGSFNKFEPGHDLYWTGYTRAFGVWYAVVTNASPYPIYYSINYKRVINSVAGRCAECHGFEIEWDRCESQGNDWCGDLEDEYNQH